MLHSDGEKRLLASEFPRRKHARLEVEHLLCREEVELLVPLRSKARSGERTLAQPTAARFSSPLFAPLFGPIPVGGKSKD